MLGAGQGQGQLRTGNELLVGGVGVHDIPDVRVGRHALAHEAWVLRARVRSVSVSDVAREAATSDGDGGQRV